jgi:monoterpene epsilon-lactone hydrolase
VQVADSRLSLMSGAYIHQPGLKQWTAVKKLAADYGCRVVLPIYPKGPKYTFKDAYPPMLRLLERTAAECANGKYLLMGDSAGGGLCIGLCLAIRDQGKDFMPTELVLSSPWTDISMSTPELEEQSDKVGNALYICKTGRLTQNGSSSRILGLIYLAFWKHLICGLAIKLKS